MQPLVNQVQPITRIKSQFQIGQQLNFKDKRTGEECTVVVENSIPSNLRYFFPDLYKSAKPLLALDMDLTLVNTKIGYVKPADIQMTLTQGAARVQYSVVLRPFLHDFLDSMAKMYDLMIFTSAGQLYADALIDRFDKAQHIKRRVYQQHCTPITENGQPVFVKDLSRIGQSLDRIILVDDNARSIQYQLDNSILIKAFDGDTRDNELEKLEIRLKKVYETYTECGNVVQALKKWK
ncbi:Nuclear_LIM interactor-interacting factor [Hexamita inflata]|uniref:Mitochondrial import inner membrane translocase subunit TIM50 n=1 Tax=Hexamita inflata TaxID=28002 RepID=A0AA86Q3V2_9EUKA|nr:Nuclear LIM interactor-interacting factor [Hexamita inflata]